MSNRRSARSILPVVIIALGVIILLGVSLWVLNPLGQPAASPTSPPLGQIQPGDVPRVSLEDAKAAYDQKSAVFLDVRGDPFFSDGHIPGALSVSNPDAEQRFSELNPGAWIIPYCT